MKNAIYFLLFISNNFLSLHYKQSSLEQMAELKTHTHTDTYTTISSQYSNSNSATSALFTTEKNAFAIDFDY